MTTIQLTIITTSNSQNHNYSQFTVITTLNSHNHIVEYNPPYLND